MGLDDLDHPAQVVGHSLVHRPQEVLAAVVGAHVEEGGAHPGVGDGRALPVHPRRADQKVGPRGDRVDVLVHQRVDVGDVRVGLLVAVELIGDPFEARPGRLHLRQQQRPVGVGGMDGDDAVPSGRGFAGDDAHPAGGAQVDVTLSLADRAGADRRPGDVSPAAEDRGSLQQPTISRCLRRQSSHLINRAHQRRELLQVQSHVADDGPQPVLLLQVEPKGGGT